MGATGIPGEFDGHWVKKLSTAILVSLAGDLFKLGSIKYGPKQEITRLEPLGGKTTEIKPYESIAVDILSKVPAEIAAKTLATPGTVTVQQGQMINIMTTRDIDFRQAKAGL
jgi:type IV secretory pathway VirB10-like protein